MSETKKIGRPEAVPRDVVRRLVALRRQGHGWRAIAKRMNTAGVPPVGGGKRWWPGTVRVILLRYRDRWET